MLEKIRQLAPETDERGVLPLESLKAAAEAGLFEKSDFAENMWTVFDLAAVCGSTAACAAVMLTAAALAEKTAPEVRAAVRDGVPVSLCFGEISYENGKISGLCPHAPFAGTAEYYVVISGDTACLVNGAAAGMETGDTDDKMGLRGMVTGMLKFENTPAVTLDAPAGKSRLQAMAAALSAGLALSGAEEAREHAYRRVQFKKRITEFENTRLTVADCFTAAEAGRAMLEKCAHAAGNRDPRFAELAAMAKLYCCRSAVDGLRRCVQVMSGRGYMRDFPVEVK